ncbi:MAG: hypothetical protein U1E76_00180 [Planctomycetota bacterium]
MAFLGTVAGNVPLYVVDIATGSIESKVDFATIDDFDLAPDATFVVFRTSFGGRAHRAPSPRHDGRRRPSDSRSRTRRSPTRSTSGRRSACRCPVPMARRCRCSWSSRTASIPARSTRSC